MSTAIRLAPGHDPALYARVFRQHGRLHIPGLLVEADARRLHAALAEVRWTTTVIRDDVVFDVPPEKTAAMTAQEKAAFDAEIFAYAARRYEGRYQTLRLSDHGESFMGGAPALNALTRFLNGKPFLDFVRQVTGVAAIALADGQATCYRPGDFLHPHLDIVASKQRHVAYVLNLTPAWKVEWGGLLGFIGEDGHVAEAYTPAWNALNLLAVDRLHYVSAVAPFAGAERLSVTGWLRGR